MLWTYNESFSESGFPQFNLDISDIKKRAFSKKPSLMLDYFLSCPFCKSKCQIFDYKIFGCKSHDLPICDRGLYVCQKCGWWSILNFLIFYTVSDKRDENPEVFILNGEEVVPGGRFLINLEYYGVTSCLKKFDVANMQTPLDEVNRYLVFKFDEVSKLHWRRVEEVVNSIFKSFGMHPRLTQATKDSGIDIFFDNPVGSLVGVQVKKSRNKIEAHLIDEFQGALIRHGATKGVFVTTSKFTRGAKENAKTFGRVGIPIELWDAEKVLDKLEITLRPAYADPKEINTPFYDRWVKGSGSPNELFKLGEFKERDE